MKLSAAVAATRLGQIISWELETKIDRPYFWTDSTCVLRHVHNDATRFQTFVANRITKIRELYHTTPNYTMPCHAMPCHSIPHHTIPCHTIPHNTTPYHAMLYHTAPHRTAQHNTTQQYNTTQHNTTQHSKLKCN